MSIIAISGKLNSGKDTIATIIQYLTTKKEDISYSGSYNSYIMDLGMGGSVTSDWQIKRFADKVKDIVCLLINCTREQLEDREFKEASLGEKWRVDYSGDYDLIERKDFDENSFSEILTPRRLLQLVGTDCGRQIIHPNLWVNSLFSEYKPFDKGKAHDRKDFSELYTHIECKHCRKSYSGWKRQYLCKECIEDNLIQFYPNWIIPDMRFPNEVKAIKEKGGLIIRVERYSKTQSTHLSETSLDSFKFENSIINNGSIEDLILKVKLILSSNKII